MHDRDPCPVCGHRRKPTLMSANPAAPGLIELLKGNGDAFMQQLAKAGVMLAAVLTLVGILAAFHVHL